MSRYERSMFICIFAELKIEIINTMRMDLIKYCYCVLCVMFEAENVDVMD